MTYNVVWQPNAEQHLASIWVAAPNREAVSEAANAIDQSLRTDPETRGESRSGNERVLIISPLLVAFEIRELDRIVSVLSVRYSAHAADGG